MLDRFMSKRSSGHDVLSTVSYQPEQAIRDVQLYNPDAPRLAVIFPPWHGGGRTHHAFIQRLVRHNWAVIDNTFHDEILKADAKQVLASYSHIQSTVTEHLLKATRQRHYEQIHLVGISLGNVALALVADAFREFTAASIVTPGSSLANCAWNGIRTQHIQLGFEKQGYDRIGLGYIWQKLAPLKYVRTFSGKPVQAVISTTDRVIPAEYQYEITDALDQAGAAVQLKQTRLGHFATIANFYLTGKLETT